MSETRRVSRGSRDAASPRCTDTAISVASSIARAIQPSLGEFCEVVVHDFRDLDRSVVCYEGNLTGRQVGSPVTPMSLELLSDADATVISDRMLQTDDGRVIKSTVAALKAEDGRTVGSFCLNLDVTSLRYALHALEALAGQTQDARSYTFPEDPPELVLTVLNQEELRLGRPLVGLDVQTRQGVIASLDGHRVFEIRRSAQLVAERLGVSRATVYSDLDKVRA